MPDIQVLDPAETNEALDGRYGRSSEVMNQLTASLTAVADTESSVFVTDLNESKINVLRTRMSRRNIRIAVHKVKRNGSTGHVMFAKTVQP